MLTYDELNALIKYVKPPLGLMPKDTWKQQRLRDVKEAIERYINSNMRIPDEWLEEYSELIKELKNNNEYTR